MLDSAVNGTVNGVGNGAVEHAAQAWPQVQQQLRRWFGSNVDGWKLLHHHRIAVAIPDQTPAAITCCVATAAPEWGSRCRRLQRAAWDRRCAGKWSQAC